MLPCAAELLPVFFVPLVEAEWEVNLKITGLQFIKLSGSLDESYKDYDRVVRPLDAYQEFAQQGAWKLVDETTGRIPVVNTYLEIMSDEGVSGIYGPLVYDITIDLIRGLKSYLIGKDPLSTELIWDQVRKLDRHGRTGFAIMALSAIDCALWDLKGKYLKQPVYKLLGGPTRDKIPVYASTLGCSLETEEAVKVAKAIKEEGYLAQKWFFKYGPQAGYHGMMKNYELAKELRAAVGDSYGLMFDAWQGWDIEYAKKMFKLLEPIHPEWIEEPLMANDINGYKELAKTSEITIATGEHLYTRWELKPFIDERLAGVLQPDPAWTGGITELKKMADLCELSSIRMMPHGCNVLSAIHVIAAASPYVCPMAEYLIKYQERQLLFQDTSIRPVGGFIQLPLDEGLGLKFSDEYIEEKEIFE